MREKKDKFDRVIGFGAVDIVPTKLSFPIPFPEKKMDTLIRNARILLDTKFEWISLVYLFSKSPVPTLELGKINNKFADLAVSFYLDSKVVSCANRKSKELLQDIFMVGALEAMLSVCAKYKLDDTVFREERAKYRDIPNTVEECESLDRLLIEATE